MISREPPAMTENLEELATLDVEGIIKRDLYDQCRAKLKSDVPEAPDWMLDMYAEDLMGSLGLKVRGPR